MSLVADLVARADVAAPDLTPAFEARAIKADLEALAREHAGGERELRTAVAQRLKTALTQGRAEAERLLLARNLSREERRARVDAAAAAIMLQDWLDARRPRPALWHRPDE
jgi:hypothetical protein